MNLKTEACDTRPVFRHLIDERITELRAADKARRSVPPQPQARPETTPGVLLGFFAINPNRNREELK